MMKSIHYNGYDTPKYLKDFINKFRPREIGRYEENGHIVRVFEPATALGSLRDRL